MSGIIHRTVFVKIQKFATSGGSEILVGQWQFDVLNRWIDAPYASGNGMTDHMEQPIPVSIIDSNTDTGEFTYKVSIGSVYSSYGGDIYSDLYANIGTLSKSIRVQEVELTQVSGNPGGAA